MPIATKIYVSSGINSSLQIGDSIYVADIQSNGVLGTPAYVQKVLLIGPDYILVDKDPSSTPIVTTGQYILFSKSTPINKSSLKGYYADVTLTNTSNEKIELFAISSETTPSSK
tara:strand:- start:1082 stop:1423 length:342 start_codon:yes stop_codon:yes gene_type:complete